MLVNKIYDKINHSLSRIKNKWFRMWVTSNSATCSRRNPKRSAKRAYHIGIPVWSIAGAGISCTKKQGSIKNSSIIRWIFFQSLRNVIKKGRPHEHRYGKKPGDKEYYTVNLLKKECKKRDFQGIHDRFLHDHEFSIRMKIIETKIFVADGMLLRMKIILTMWPQKNTSTIRANGGFSQISKVLILCHWGKDLISNKHCLPCINWNKQKETHKCLLTLTQDNNGHRVLLLHSGIGKGQGGTPYPSESQEGGEPSIECTRRPVSCSIWQ